MYYFITSQVATDEMRQQVYDVWTFYRHIEPDRYRFIEVARREDISVDMFFGRFDKIIPVSNASGLIRMMPEVRIHILECGHGMLTGEWGRNIAERGLLTLPGNAEKAVSTNLSRS